MIDKVGYAAPVAKARDVKKAAKTGASGFASALSQAQESSATTETEAATGVNTVGLLLGFQEVDSADIDRRKAYKQGKMTLDALAQLRDALLMGALPLSTIEKLERLVASERSQTNDPLLNNVLDEIELRAAVEVAKLEVASGRVHPPSA